MSKTNTEYLPNFDVACDQLIELTGLDDEATATWKKSELTKEDIITKRQALMQIGLEKYGPVYMNYFKVNKMQPLDDAIARIKWYDKTHDLDYLVSAMNFFMLAYWQCTKAVIKLKEPEMWAVMLKDDMTYELFSAEQIKNYIDFFTFDRDLGYILVAALRVLFEIRFPTYPDSECKGAETAVEIYGFSYKELQTWGDVGTEDEVSDDEQDN